MKELWKNIKDYDGCYRISNFGKVKSLTRRVINRSNKAGTRIVRERILRPASDTKGYLRVSLSKSNRTKGMAIHQLVAKAFIRNPKNKKYVNHKDRIKTNNKMSNLEWVTKSEDIAHIYRVGGRKLSSICRFGAENPHSKPVLQICKDTNKVIRRWISASEAGRVLRFDLSQICKVCRGTNKTAYGFKWTFAKKERK